MQSTNSKGPYPLGQFRVGRLQKSADSTAESADSATDSVIVGRLALSNVFNILNPLESADGSRPLSEKKFCFGLKKIVGG